MAKPPQAGQPLTCRLTGQAITANEASVPRNTGRKRLLAGRTTQVLMAAGSGRELRHCAVPPQGGFVAQNTLLSDCRLQRKILASIVTQYFSELRYFSARNFICATKSRKVVLAGSMSSSNAGMSKTVKKSCDMELNNPCDSRNI
mgnify:CR=1 FL=1